MRGRRPGLPSPDHGDADPSTVLFLHVSAGGYGADRQLYLLATGLDPARYRPLVVLEERGVLGARLEEAGVEVVTTPLAVLRRALLRGRSLAATAKLTAQNARELGELAQARGAAIVHSNTSLVLCGQAVANRAEAVHVQHVREIYRGLGGRAGSALWPLLRRRLARADALVCVSHAVAAQFEGENVLVVHDAATRSQAPPDRGAARRAFGLDGDSFVVAVVGRISDWKGQGIFLQALAEPALSEIAAVGLVAGDAAPDQKHFERELLTLRAELRLGDRVRLLGFRDDVDAVFAAADAVALPATHADAFPNAALEASLAGLPIVATSTGGQPEIVREGVTGRLVPPGDPVALAAVLRQFADDRGAGLSLGATARADAQTRFGTARLLEEVQNVYEAALRNRANGRPAAWLLPCKELPVSQPAAPQLRLARIETWLRELGYRPVVFPARRIPLAPGLVLRALRERPTLVLTNTAAYAPALSWIKRLRGKRVLVVADVMGLHSLEVDQASRRVWMRPLVRRVWMLLERMLLRSADIVLAVNDRHAALIRARYRAARVHTLRDGAEVELAALSPVDRTSLGIPADAVAVGYVGSLVYSRLDPLLAAWSALAGDGTRNALCLVIVGDGPDLERYRRLAAAESWLGRSVFLPGALPRDRALGALRACDIAYSDCWTAAGFPAKLYEYMALGMPIVTERTLQAAEVFEEGRDALLFGTPDELADQIRRLAQDPELRNLLGANAGRTFLAGHTLDHRRREFVALIGKRA